MQAEKAFLPPPPGAVGTVFALRRLPLLVPTLQPCGFVRCLLEVLISGLQYETEERYNYKSPFLQVR